MQRKELTFYRCPQTASSLHFTADTHFCDEEVSSGALRSENGTEYFLVDGIPDFTYPQLLDEADKGTRNEYDCVAKEYDSLQNVTFEILLQDEKTFRTEMVELLHLKDNSVVLETAAGTGLNMPFLADAMEYAGKIFAQDISSKMLEKCPSFISNVDKDKKVNIFKSIGNAASLPFPSNFFDAVLSFGGIGVFSDKNSAIQEMFRVTKPGGRVVFGDEGIAPWLRDSIYGKILMSNNVFYADEVPLNLLPVEARNVGARWVMGGAFYLVDATVGEGEPAANFNYLIPGLRGGTLNTRYYGELEGVTPETKALIREICLQNNKSIHQWLEDTLQNALTQARGEQHAQKI